MPEVPNMIEDVFKTLILSINNKKHKVALVLSVEPSPTGGYDDEIWLVVDGIVVAWAVPPAKGDEEIFFYLYRDPRIPKKVLNSAFGLLSSVVDIYAVRHIRTSYF